MVKVFRSDQFHLALKEIIFYRQNIKGNKLKEDLFAVQNGCLFDDEYIYILMEENNQYSTLSNNKIYNKIRKMDLEVRIKILNFLTKAVNEIHRMGFIHNMISPDSFLVSLETQKIKLMHFENITLYADKPPTSLITVKGVVYKDYIINSINIDEALNRYPQVNNDLYALVKVMLHLDEDYFESRLDRNGEEIYDEYYKPSYQSIIEMHQQCFNLTVNDLLDVVQSRCTLERYSEELSGIMGSIKRLGSIIGLQPQIYERYICKGLKKVYQDILTPHSKDFIATSDQLLRQIDTLLKYNTHMDDTVNTIIKNFQKRTSTLDNGKM